MKQNDSTLRMIRGRVGAAAGALLLALLGACAASSPPPVLLTLPAAAPAAAVAPASPASSPLLAVRRVAIPEYVVARRVRYRADPSTLAEWPNTYWAERIEIGVTREFVAAMRAQLPGWSLCDTSCGDAVPALSLQVELVPMDYLRPSQTLQARARIVVGSGANGPTLLTQELPFVLSGGADNAQTQARLMAELIRQVAQAAAPLVKSALPVR
ncbi:MAG TPA: ABC-type transport auxiliary lipoprotein family protein [Burkholderiaceae bacterium]|jgi:uncharacterized lipoprotein YmbA